MNIDANSWLLVSSRPPAPLPPQDYRQLFNLTRGRRAHEHSGLWISLLIHQKGCWALSPHLRTTCVPTAPWTLCCIYRSALPRPLWHPWIFLRIQTV